MINVTLNQIRKAGPCPDGWIKALKANGGVNADMDKPFPLVSILDSNDLDDILWVISNVTELFDYNEIWRKFACFCAMQNIKKIEKFCSRDNYNLIIQWIETKDPYLRESANRAANIAANNAVNRATNLASWYAAKSVICATAWSVAESVSSGAEYAALAAATSSAWATDESTAGTDQENKLRELIGNNTEI